MKSASTTVWHVAARLPAINDVRAEHAILFKSVGHAALANAGRPDERARHAQYIRVDTGDAGHSLYLCRIAAPQLPPGVVGKPVTLTVTEGERLRVRFLTTSKDKGQRNGPNRQGRQNFQRVLTGDELRARLESYGARMGLDAESINHELKERLSIERGRTTLYLDAYKVNIVGRVKDPEALVTAFEQGIGKFRTYGLGMITVEPVMPAEEACR